MPALTTQLNSRWLSPAIRSMEHVLSLWLFCHFICLVEDFLTIEQSIGMKFCMVVCRHLPCLPSACSHFMSSSDLWVWGIGCSICSCFDNVELALIWVVLGFPDNCKPGYPTDIKKVTGYSFLRQTSDVDVQVVSLHEYIIKGLHHNLIA